MARRAVVYDINRLVTRIFNRTPNGIDRVDFAFADYFLSPEFDGRSGVMMTALGPRVLSRQAARRAIDIVRKHWGEDETPGEDGVFQALLAAICDRPAPMTRISRPRRGQTGDILRWLREHGSSVGQRATDFLPPDGLYVNCSQFPLDFDRYFQWMDPRSELDSVFFIHDLLPLETPEYFPPSERPRHARKIATLARRASAAIVSTEVVKQSLLRQLATHGRTHLPILVAPLPVDPAFSKDGAKAAAIEGHPYFVMCATIEPRKNHLLILHVWRDLVAELGQAAPKLVLIGRRGWENEHIIDLLERCPGLQHHVLEVAGLPTPSVKQLLMGARALLMPSFAEGYGLPVVEALSCGVPVLASSIPVFEEICGDKHLRLDPTDGPGWRAAVMGLASDNSAQRIKAIRDIADYRAPDWPSFFRSIEEFLDELPARGRL
jgi:glycosyltransferase involved in cell wall biosynthesis